MYKACLFIISHGYIKKEQRESPGGCKDLEAPCLLLSRTES